MEKPIETTEWSRCSDAAYRPRACRIRCRHDRLQREYLSQAILDAMDVLLEEYSQLIGTCTDAMGGRCYYHDEEGQATYWRDRFDFLVRDWELSMRSRHTDASRFCVKRSRVGC